MDKSQPGAGARRFYAISENEDGSTDIYLMPDERVLVVRGIIPWEGMEYDIRARYTAWCEIGVRLL